jgi:hypothetical protein
MIFTWWFIVVGAVFLLMALSSSLLARLPLSTAMLKFSPVAIKLLRPKRQDLVTDRPDATHDHGTGGHLSPQLVDEVVAMEPDQGALLGSQG